jgi:glycosyltransferase involved in cell wall biosynthesis
LNRICFVLTIPFTLNAFVRPHLDRLSANYDVTIFLNMKDTDIVPVVPARVRLVQLGIIRQIALFEDLRTLFELTGIFRRERFDLVISMTPKGGLLAMIAAWLAGSPRRVHCFTGQVWATRRGFSRWLLKTMDRLLAFCATRLLADSGSQRQYLIDEGIVVPEKIEVLANGSMAGVDVRRFRPDAGARSRIRSQLGIGDDACCLLFVGRMTGEKGVPDLIQAFDRLAVEHPKLQLMLVGPAEEGFESLFRDNPRVHRVGYTSAVEEYMAAADVFCLPSYREGFGLVLIEAGAVGLPVVASRIYGITDAVIEGETGLLHQPGDVADLVEKLEVLVGNPSLRNALGVAGRRRAQAAFSADLVTTEMANFLQRMFDERQQMTRDEP